MQPTRFLASQVAAFAGTIVDYLVTIVAVEAGHLDHVLAVAAGNVAGGCINFYLGRHYVFGEGQQALLSQVSRYFLVWLGSLLLNTGGVYLLMQSLHLSYLVSKIGVGLLVGVGFNYALQQKFVFRKS